MARALRRSLGVSASYIRSAFPTPSNRPLRPRLRAYRQSRWISGRRPIIFWTSSRISPHTSTTGFVNRRSGVQSSQPAPARNHCGTVTSCIFPLHLFARQKSPKTRFGCIFGCKSEVLAGSRHPCRSSRGRRPWPAPAPPHWWGSRAAGVGPERRPASASRLPRLFDRRLRRQRFLIPLSEARPECERGHEQQDAPENDAKETIIHRHQTDCFQFVRGGPPPVSLIPVCETQERCGNVARSGMVAPWSKSGERFALLEQS